MIPDTFHETAQYANNLSELLPPWMEVRGVSLERKLRINRRELENERWGVSNQHPRLNGFWSRMLRFTIYSTCSVTAFERNIIGDL